MSNSQKYNDHHRELSISGRDEPTIEAHPQQYWADIARQIQSGSEESYNAFDAAADASRNGTPIALIKPDGTEIVYHNGHALPRYTEPAKFGL